MSKCMEYIRMEKQIWWSSFIHEFWDAFEELKSMQDLFSSESKITMERVGRKNYDYYIKIVFSESDEALFLFRKLSGIKL